MFAFASGQTIIDTEKQLHSPVGFTLGFNLAGPFNSILDADRTAFSFITRLNLKENLFFRGEAGFENINFKKEAYHYESNGSFIKGGVEINAITKAEPTTNAQLLFGLHYGIALQKQNASTFIIENSYWKDYTGRIGSHTANHHWLELSGGPRIELFSNFYISWILQIRIITFKNNPEILRPYLIPGFGNGDTRLNGGFAYTLEYLIPWKK